jgi:hypothetical protein
MREELFIRRALPCAIDEKAFSLPNDAKRNQRRKKESTMQKGMFAITYNDGCSERALSIA